jgi:hypothetical protein
MMMDRHVPRRVGASTPEAKIQEAVVKYLRDREWLVKHLVGNMYQSGWPDLWASHSKYGHRWIEIKLPGMKGSRFTPAQLEWFPKLCAHGSGVWIMTAAAHTEYEKLWKPPNWWVYTM